MRGFWFELASNIAAEASAVHTLFLLHSAARPRSPFPEVQSISSGLFPSNASAVVKRNVRPRAARQSLRRFNATL